MKKEAMRYFGDNPLDAATVRRVNAIAALRSFYPPAVLFPNAHAKSYLEAPVSASYRTAHTLVPHLSAASLGCGMGIIATGLNVRDGTPLAFFEDFVKEFKRSPAEYRASAFKNILLWFGAGRIPRAPFDPSTKEEWRRVLTEGSGYLVDRARLDSSFLDHVEYGGSLMTEEERQEFSLRLLPRSVYALVNNFGFGMFDGEHFLEMRTVEEIFDEPRARAWHLTPGQILLMYHYSGGKVPFYVGRYYASRIKHGRREAVFAFPGKFLHHFCSLRGIASGFTRWRYYFTKGLREMDLRSPEGRRAFLAYKAAVNAAYYHHSAFIARMLRRLNQAPFSGKAVGGELLWQSIHNLITEERTAGAGAVLHTHGTVPVLKDKPVLVSGHNFTPSYLSVGHEASERVSWGTMCHTATTTAQEATEPEHLPPHPKSLRTVLYKRGVASGTIPHTRDEDTDGLMGRLEERGVVKIVAKLRPLAVYKD